MALQLWEKHTSGEFIDSTINSGFSLVEVLVTLVVICSFMGVVSTSVPGVEKTIGGFLQQLTLEEEYLIFLVLFEKDYNFAEVSTTSDLIGLDSMKFQRDHNNDGDFLDSGEAIQYRWNSEKQRIDRKSGNGYFQAFLEGIDAFSWEKTGSQPVCYEMKLLPIISQKSKTVTFCRANLAEL